MEGALKQHKAKTTQGWSHGSESRRGTGPNPTHASLALTAMVVTDSHMLISQGLYLVFKYSGMNTGVHYFFSSPVLYSSCIPELPESSLKY